MSVYWVLLMGSSHQSAKHTKNQLTPVGGGRGYEATLTLHKYTHTHAPCTRTLPTHTHGTVRGDIHHLTHSAICQIVCVSECVSMSWCAPVSHGVRLGNRLGVSRGVRAGSPPSELRVSIHACIYGCVCLYVCVCTGLNSSTRARWQADVNKMDGVDSNYKFIVSPESMENK